MKAGEGDRGSELLAGAARFERRPGLLAQAMAPALSKVLSQLDRGIERGALHGCLPDGSHCVLGGRNPGVEAHVHLHDWRGLMRLATNGSIGWYQAWEAGEWDSPDMVKLFALFSANADSLGDTGRAAGPFRWLARFTHWLNRNSRAGSERNIQAHYDLGNDFYRLWLDQTMSYSSAIWRDQDDLQIAQRRKWDAMARRVEGAKTLLEIGCGWGGLSDYFAQRGARVTAISLSAEQLAWARQMYGSAIEFRKQDYRDTSGKFDAIVSVEMVEALGRENWPTFMDCIARNLKSGGRAAIQFISLKETLFDAYAKSADFIQAYIFPGGLLIRTSEFRRLAEERGLAWQEQRNFGHHYATTLKEWRRNFERAIARGMLPAGFDERFRRLWRYYLMYCEGGFRGGGIDVHQATLVKR